MAWRAVHPALTEERRVPAEDPEAPTFTLGFWPPLEAEKAKIYISKVRRQNTGGTLPEELHRRAAIDLEAFWAMTRFGVRSWSGLGELPCKTEKVTLDGREHVVLTDESLQILYHSGLLLPVALECWRFNSLTEEEKKTSNSPSNSTTWTNGMPASAVTTSSVPAKSAAESFDSTDAPSPAAPTT